MTSTSRIRLADLNDAPLFLDVSAEAADGFLDRCKLLTLRRNDILLHQGSQNRNLYLVLSGSLGIHLDSLDSDPIVLLGRGETVGEMSLIDQKGASAYVMAASETQLLIFEEESIWSLVRASHAAACNLLAIITARLRNTNVVLAERMRLEHGFHHYGNVDALTGLHNRYWLNNTLVRLLKRHAHSGKPLSAIMTDIDHFREFNTLYGHACGDRVIHTVGRVFTEHLRPSEMAARYGGDEFVILLPGVALPQAWVAAERLRAKVNEARVHLESGTAVPTPTISAGIALFQSGDSPETFIAAADAALYRAKEQGRNSVAE